MKCLFNDEASEQCIHKQDDGTCTGYCARPNPEGWPGTLHPDDSVNERLIAEEDE